MQLFLLLFMMAEVEGLKLPAPGFGGRCFIMDISIKSINKLTETGVGVSPCVIPNNEIYGVFNSQLRQHHFQ